MTVPTWIDLEKLDSVDPLGTVCETSERFEVISQEVEVHVLGLLTV